MDMYILLMKDCKQFSLRFVIEMGEFWSPSSVRDLSFIRGQGGVVLMQIWGRVIKFYVGEGNQKFKLGFFWGQQYIIKQTSDLHCKYFKLNNDQPEQPFMYVNWYCNA